MAYTSGSDVDAQQYGKITTFRIRIDTALRMRNTITARDKLIRMRSDKTSHKRSGKCPAIGEKMKEQAALYAALAKAQGEFSPLGKNRAVSIRTKQGYTYEFRYADLEAVLSATRPALAANGLAVIQSVVQLEGSNISQLKTILAHSEGGLIESSINLPADNYGDIKQYGASISYLRRYAYTSLVCVAADDDLDEEGDHIDAPNAGPAEKPKYQKKGPEPYPDESFKQNLPAWKAAVEEGKATPERILAMVGSKAVLSEEQIKAIKALANNEGEGK